MDLHRVDCIAQTCPIGPIHPATFHVIDRNSVDQYGYVPLVKPANIDPAISKSAAAFGGINPWRDIQSLDQFFVAYLLFDGTSIQSRNSNRSLSIYGDRRNDVRLCQTNGGALHHDESQVNRRHSEVAPLTSGQLDKGAHHLKTDHAHHQMRLARLAGAKAEVSIKIGHTARRIFFQINRSPHKGFARDLVQYPARYLGLGVHC